MNEVGQERLIALCKRVGVEYATGPAEAWVMMWAKIGVKLAAEQPEFRRARGRPKGSKRRPSNRRSIDLKLIKLIQHMTGVEGFDLKTTTREVIKFAEEKGVIAAGDRRTNSKRIKRLYSE